MGSRRQFMTGIAAATAAAALLPPSSRAAAKPVRLGFSMAQTGMFASAAPSQLNAYNLWKDQLNAGGGLDLAGEKRPIEFVMYDDQSNPSQAAKIYEKLITGDKVDLLLAPWGTPTHIAIAPVIERFKFPLIGNTAASVSLRDLKPGNFWFSTPDFPDRVAHALAEMLVAQKVKSIALLTNVLPFGKEIKTYLLADLKNAKIDVLVNEEYPPDITDMTAMLSKVKAAKPEGVISLSYPEDSPIYVRQAKELNLPATFQFVLVGPGIDFFYKALGSAAENIVFMGQWTPQRNAAAKTFNDAYIARFKQRPDYLDSIESYDSCQMLQQAVKVAGLDKNKLRAAISQGKFETIDGPIHFTGIENLVTHAGFLQLQGGTPQQVWPAAEATAAYRPKTAY